MPLNKKEEKRLYDIEYRKKNKELLKVKKSIEYFRLKHTDKYQNKVKAYRKKITKRHVAYCAKPDQKKKTRERDQIRTHGEYRECYELCMEILHFVQAYYKKNSNGVGHRYARLKARGYFEARLDQRRLSRKTKVA